MDREIIHRCGHARRHHVGGWCVADQDRAAARLARRRCADCAMAGPVPAAPSPAARGGSPRRVARL